MLLQQRQFVSAITLTLFAAFAVTTTSRAGKGNARGKRMAWSWPCMKIFAMPVSDIRSSSRIASVVVRLGNLFLLELGEQQGVFAAVG